MDGMLQLKIAPWTRALVTRMVALGPALAIVLYASSADPKFDIIQAVCEGANVLQGVGHAAPIGPPGLSSLYTCPLPLYLVITLSCSFPLLCAPTQLRSSMLRAWKCQRYGLASPPFLSPTLHCAYDSRGARSREHICEYN